MTSRHRSETLRTVVIVVAVIACLLPIIWTLLASFGVRPDASRAPLTFIGSPNLTHYLEIGVTQLQYVPKLVTSILLGLLTTLMTVLVAFSAAYGLARSRFHGREVVVQSLVVLASLPVIAYLIPLRETLHVLHLYDTLIGASLVEAGLYAPLATYVLHGYLRRSPVEIEDAARLEGAGIIWLLWRVVLPVVAPGVAATAIVVLVLSWNQVLMPLVLTLNVKTVPVSMIDFFTYERELEWPTAAAALIASFVPIWAVVMVAHRFLDQFSLDGGVE